MVSKTNSSGRGVGSVSLIIVIFPTFSLTKVQITVSPAPILMPEIVLNEGVPLLVAPVQIAETKDQPAGTLSDTEYSTVLNGAFASPASVLTTLNSTGGFSNGDVTSGVICPSKFPSGPVISKLDGSVVVIVGLGLNTVSPVFEKINVPGNARESFTIVILASGA